MISDSVLSAKEIYDKPTFDLKFSSNGYSHAINFSNGVLTSKNINQEVLEKLNKLTGGYSAVGKLEDFGPYNIKEIYDIISSKYNSVQYLKPRDKKTRYTDSFYLNFKKALAPIYTEIVNNYNAELEAGKEKAKDDQTKKAYDDLLTDLEAENGSNIADIERDRIIKGTIEGLLYGIPAIICIYLIIKKIRS